jgi:nucleoside-diphosphate-sugar epimerase
MDKIKILITGGNGYIAKSLYNAFKDKYDITCITRQDFDLTSFQSMNEFFQNKYFDIVIHCAVQGGSRLKTESYKDMDANLASYYNLLQHRSYYNKLIHFGSGAEINTPESPYGLSKRIIAKSISEIDNFYNIKIFGVFDENELDTRLIKGNIKRYINKEPMIIHQDKFMDFFYMKDLISLVDYYINNDNPPKQIDCSYDKLYKLSDVANIINGLNDYKVTVKIEQEGMDLPYYGVANILLKFIGLEQGIKEVYNKLKNEH